MLLSPWLFANVSNIIICFVLFLLDWSKMFYPQLRSFISTFGRKYLVCLVLTVLSSNNKRKTLFMHWNLWSTKYNDKNICFASARIPLINISCFWVLISFVVVVLYSLELINLLSEQKFWYQLLQRLLLYPLCKWLSLTT